MEPGSGWHEPVSVSVGAPARCSGLADTEWARQPVVPRQQAMTPPHAPLRSPERLCAAIRRHGMSFSTRASGVSVGVAALPNMGRGPHSVPLPNLLTL